eukprot:842922-Pelagomonas_calceolata.AAC.5
MAHPTLHSPNQHVPKVLHIVPSLLFFDQVGQHHESQAKGRLQQKSKRTLLALLQLRKAIDALLRRLQNHLLGLRRNATALSKERTLQVQWMSSVADTHSYSNEEAADHWRLCSTHMKTHIHRFSVASGSWQHKMGMHGPQAALP